MDMTIQIRHPFERTSFDPNSTQALRLKQDSMIENLAAFQGAIKRLERLELAITVLRSVHEQVKASLKQAGLHDAVTLLEDTDLRISDLLNAS